MIGHFHCYTVQEHADWPLGFGRVQGLGWATVGQGPRILQGQF